MGRKRKGQAVQERVDRYLEVYKLDDLNEANDMAALTQMCQLELTMESIQEALSTLKIKDTLDDSKRVKDLTSSLRDTTNAWTALQKALGIARDDRKSKGDETPLQYIEKLKEQSKSFLDKRLKSLSCDKCGQVLGKFIFYVIDKGEQGSIESERKPVEPYKYTVRCECWKCANGHIANSSNENIVLVEK